jgi:hypothetical protein
VALLVQGFPDDLRECVSALLRYAPADVAIAGLDLGNVAGAGDALHELAAAHQGRVTEWHVPAGPGWGAARTALLRADPAAIHVIMETSTILTGDALTPLLAGPARMAWPRPAGAALIPIPASARSTTPGPGG